MDEKCVRCGEEGQDRRTLFMACFYDMDELKLPFEFKDVGDRKFFTLRVCKECRGDWMGAIKEWFNSYQPVQKQTGTGIFVRELGHTRELAPEEVKERYPNWNPQQLT